MGSHDRKYRAALEIANRFLSRWTDRFTRDAREDLAQDAVLEVWKCRGRLRAPDRFEAFVRTISRRVRYRALRRRMRERATSSYDHGELADSISSAVPADEWLYVDGRPVDKTWLLEELDHACARVTELNRELVREYYAGSSCRELAVRYGLAEESVKVRLYRSRRKLKQVFEKRARRAFSSV